MREKLLQFLPDCNKQLMKAGLLMGLCLVTSPFLMAEEKEAPGVPVTVAYPERQVITEWNEFTGRFEAFQRVEVRARVGGYLKAINFIDGGLVAKGDLLFTLDSRPFEAAIASARAQLARAEANLSLAKLGLARADKLVVKKSISQEDLDTRSSTVKARQADFSAAKAALDITELDLEYSRISAPISGQISRREIDTGNLIQADGSQILTTIVAKQPVYFVFDMSESDYLKYKRQSNKAGDDTLIGQTLTVQVRLLDEQNYDHNGRVDFVDTHLDVKTGTIRLRAVFDSNASGLLLPGSFGRVRLPAGQPGPVLLIPDAAIMADMNQKVVMVVDEGNRVQPRAVELGPMHEGLRVIRSGLESHDRVITKGLLRVRPGVLVTPQQANVGEPAS
ncbi:MAG: efflux RND transporter periplasmic adaptor subunit [Porticoccus sp.]|nr:efflux RND transporter periplasmic adaptor subunit [Porticoccus sp.]